MTISFYAGEEFTVSSVGSNALGFYGPSAFNAPVPIDTWQGRTFITDPSGLSEIAEVDNIKYSSLTGCIIGTTGVVKSLDSIPNYLATLNIRGEFDSQVTTTNAKLYIYDGVDETYTSPALGVTTAVYEVSHLDTAQTAIGSGGPGVVEISGADSWYLFTSNVTTPAYSMTTSPGISGTRISGSSTIDTRHDWYLAISVKPTSPGSKQWGLAFTVDYF